MVIDVTTFQGAGGSWIGARRSLADDIPHVGIEWDHDACRTVTAAGGHAIRADVASFPLGPLVGRVRLFQASPPGTSFSASGTRAGTGCVDFVYRCLADLAAGMDTRAETIAACAATIRPTLGAAPKSWRGTPDEWGAARATELATQTVLVVEPLRWALTIRPRCIVLEQVPAVLPIWHATARHLRDIGYSVAVGTLSAEQFGVPQTRNRAYLVASLDGPVVAMPVPTHQRFEPGVPAGGSPDCEESLFGPGLRPWVSMAEALGWGVDRPSFTISGGGGESQWELRPATTINGDDRLSKPGHHGPVKGESSQYGAIPTKLTTEQGLILMGWPADWPLQGSKMSKWKQVGNGCCPQVIEALVSAAAK